VRELEKVILRALVLASGDRLEAEHLPDEIRRGGPPAFSEERRTLKGEVEELEKMRVRQALEERGWNRSKAARDLGLSLRGLRNKIQRYGLEHD
jgi:DNA-binding NtrC family response regulator